MIIIITITIIIIITIIIPVSGAPLDVEGGIVISIQVIVTLRGAAVARHKAGPRWALRRGNQ